MGCQTLLLSTNVDTIGQMSCNPAIGGLAKGHLAREIDALGGEMGRTTDLTGLQFRMLNTKKGPSVWAPRAQCDKKAYQFRMKWVCERQDNLDVRQAQGTKLLIENDEIRGIETNLEVRFLGRTVVLTTGTFLRGLMHIGATQLPGGRSGEAPANSLSASLKEIGLDLGRLKTGTPPRLLKRSIDWAKTQAQHGDEPVPYFSYWREDLFHVEQSRPTDPASPMFHVEHPGSNGSYPPSSILAANGGQLPCFVTFTTQATADIIRANLHRSPLYAGAIEGIGPRYCPSIEDKIVKFADKDRHQIFLEPEGLTTDEIYVNGFSTSLPFDIQVQLVRTIIGCENAEIVRPAYAVEYDFVYPRQLWPTLETKSCGNLFLAGQINGTSGYEEAGAQGLLAGINAARRAQDKEPVTFSRSQAYLGVLVDDLITKDTTEPYRMFTSRAEYRLLLRQDNAHLRLSEVGHRVGLLPERLYREVVEFRHCIETEIQRLSTCRVGPDTLAQLLRRPEITYGDLPSQDPNLPDDAIREVETQIKYAGYIERQTAEVARFISMDSKGIPPDFDFGAVIGLRSEARQKLIKVRPSSIGEASRISGVSPSDVSLLLVWLKRAGK
jgi:tRNA uridine 5-carboxymethylaminomethyl modification enzyme